MGDAQLVAEGFRYPRPGRLEMLEESFAGIGGTTSRREMERFVDAIREMSLAEWEELHTITLDLSPLFVPYVGHAVWGESYRRGAFMADLARAYGEIGLDLGGELPDHIEPVLRYLDAAAAPLGDLVEVLPTGLMRMAKELEKADRNNPYLHLLAAARAVIDEKSDTLRRVHT